LIVFAPEANWLPFTVNAAEPEFETAAVPSVVVPSVNVTVPVDAGVTFAVNTVLDVAPMLAGLAETLVDVVTGPLVTVTVVDPLDPVKAAVPLYVAVMVLLPSTNLPALRVSVAAPLALSVAAPRTEAPAENVTVPDVAAFTVAVNTVL
jgi:hypothetical protein